MEAKPQNRSDIAHRFIALRRKIGLSQTRLGEFVGLCRQAVNEIERCRVTPHDSTWERFCEYEAREQDCGIGHLPKDYWRRCLVEDELTEKGDTNLRFSFWSPSAGGRL